MNEAHEKIRNSVETLLKELQDHFSSEGFYDPDALMQNFTLLLAALEYGVLENDPTYVPFLDVSG